MCIGECVLVCVRVLVCIHMCVCVLVHMLCNAFYNFHVSKICAALKERERKDWRKGLWRERERAAKRGWGAGVHCCEVCTTN